MFYVFHFAIIATRKLVPTKAAVYFNFFYRIRPATINLSPWGRPLGCTIIYYYYASAEFGLY